MADPNVIKVCLTNKGEDTETPWATDLGPAGADGSRKVRLVNVPFMHAKPTWGDTIIVKPPRTEGPPTWDREGVPWKQIATKIVEDGGRWAMIVDYAPTTSASEALAALEHACGEAKIVCEGAWGPRDHDPGRVYLAVQKELTAEQVMGILIGASLPMDLIQIHPEPKKRVRAQTVVGISDDAGRPPAKQPRAKTEPPVVAKSAASKPTKGETSSAMKSAAIKKTETSSATRSAKVDNAVAASKATVGKAKPAEKAAPAKPAPASKPPAKPATKAAPALKAAAKPAPKTAPPPKAVAKPAAKVPAKPAPKAAAKKSAPSKPAKKK